MASSRASDLNPRAQQPPGFTCSSVLSFLCCWLGSLALHWVWFYTPAFTWRIWVLGVSLDSSPAPFLASRKRYLGRRAALGHLNTTVPAAWPLLWRRRRPQVKPTGGVLPGGGAGEKPASLCQPSWPNPDSDHPPRPATGGARPRPQGPLLAECPVPAAWPGQPGAFGSSSPSLMPGPGALSLPLGCLHPLQGPLGLLPVWPNDSEVRAIKQLEGQCLHAGPSPALPAWTLSPGDNFFPSSCLLPSPGRREATPTALWLVRALEGGGQPPAPLGPHLYSAGAGVSWEEEGSAELPSG